VGACWPGLHALCDYLPKCVNILRIGVGEILLRSVQCSAPFRLKRMSGWE